MTRPVPSSSRILRAATVWGVVATVAIALVGGVIGFLALGSGGAFSALAGAALAAVFMLMTAASILIANRWFGDDLYVPIFFGIVLGGWILKLIVFLVGILLLRGQPWIEPMAFFLAVVASVVASLVIDAVALVRMRVPYADVALPGEGDGDGEDAPDGSDRHLDTE